MALILHASQIIYGKYGVRTSKVWHVFHCTPPVCSLSPQRGVVYFMGLSSMLPALALMAHQPTALQSQQQRQQQRRRPPQSYGDLKVGGDFGNPGVGVDFVNSGGTRHPAVSGKPKESSSEALRVLDLCAAPGGKTALMAELMGNRGMLLAVDSR
ncbi:hypothetical protein Vafri_3134 [Volvox africanus]|uniref:SAM-dependent MTase RsmB/NOP-type domain-containing protein n=1 Tax=Volvox africanus TaxID=51714 RepID=A0A8J4ESJ5_9CHLO|nr:hypothetical protein Vafri_3134 [Volvox africanus]